MPSRDARAPGFTLPGTDGDVIETYDLSTFTTAGATILIFYPFDFSPICTKELCEFRDAEWLTFTPDVDVLGISTDSAYAHQRFSQENDLNFPLLSDTSGTVIDEYGVRYDEWEGHREVSKRALMILDDDQRIRYRWETEDANDNPPLAAVYDEVISLSSVTMQHDQTTPD